MSLFERPEPVLAAGVWMILAHILGDWRLGRFGLGVLGMGLFMVLKGCQELVAPRHPRLARGLLLASVVAAAVAGLDGMLGWL